MKPEADELSLTHESEVIAGEVDALSPKAERRPDAPDDREAIDEDRVGHSPVIQRLAGNAPARCARDVSGIDAENEAGLVGRGLRRERPAARRHDREKKEKPARVHQRPMS